MGPKKLEAGHTAVWTHGHQAKISHITPAARTGRYHLRGEPAEKLASTAS
jgi:hypothetical protein